MSPKQIVTNVEKKHVPYVLSDYWCRDTDDPILVTVEPIFGSFYVIGMYGKLALPLKVFE